MATHTHTRILLGFISRQLQKRRDGGILLISLLPFSFSFSSSSNEQKSFIFFKKKAANDKRNRFDWGRKRRMGARWWLEMKRTNKTINCFSEKTRENMKKRVNGQVAISQQRRSIEWCWTGTEWSGSETDGAFGRGTWSDRIERRSGRRSPWQTANLKENKGNWALLDEIPLIQIWVEPNKVWLDKKLRKRFFQALK